MFVMAVATPITTLKFNYLTSVFDGNVEVQSWSVDSCPCCFNYSMVILFLAFFFSKELTYRETNLGKNDVR